VGGRIAAEPDTGRLRGALPGSGRSTVTHDAAGDARDLALEPLDMLRSRSRSRRSRRQPTSARASRATPMLHRRIAGVVTGARPDDPIDVDFEAADTAAGERAFPEALEIARRSAPRWQRPRARARGLLPPEQSGRRTRPTR
jgi:hypothetical protein